MSSREPYRLKLLGPWDLRGPDGAAVRSLLAQPKRLCLLAYLALGAEPVSRARVLALFWPESDEERARNALNQAVHYLRRSLTKDVVRSVEGERLWVPRESVWFDAREALEGRSPLVDPDEERSVTGPDEWEFFDGWNAEDSQPLQEWLDSVRRDVRLLARAPVREETGEPPEPDTARPRVPPTATRAIGGGARDVLSTVRNASVAAAAALAILIAMGFGWSQGRASVTRGTEPVEVAVLMPTVSASGIAPALSGDHIHEELVAGLGRLEGVVTQSVRTVQSVAELVALLEAQGASDRPEWAVTLSVRMNDGRARVIAMLLRGPDYAETPASKVGDYPVGTVEHALLELPREIAAGAISDFGPFLAAGR